MAIEALYDIKEVQQVTELNKETIQYLIRRKILSSVKIDTNVFIPCESVNVFLNSEQYLKLKGIKKNNVMRPGKIDFNKLNSINKNRLLSIKEVAKYLGVSNNCLRVWYSERNFPKPPFTAKELLDLIKRMEWDE